MQGGEGWSVSRLCVCAGRMRWFVCVWRGIVLQVCALCVCGGGGGVGSMCSIYERGGDGMERQPV